MYKKITHTIVEEHFDHPISAKIKSSIEKTRRASVPNTEIFDSDVFRSKVNSYFTNYSTSLIKIIDSMTGTEEELVSAFESAFATIDSIGEMMHPIYPMAFGERMNTDLRAWMILTTIGTQAAKVSQDNPYWKFRLGQISTDLANNLTYYNNLFAWPGTSTLTNNISTAITDKFTAKQSKNSVAEADATTRIVNLVKQLSDSLSENTIQRYPERFTTKTMSMNMTCPPSPTPQPTPSPT